MTRVWYDWEFIDTGDRLIGVSLGIVREDGATYYAEPRETDRSLASPWVRENVICHLDSYRVEGTFSYAVEAMQRAKPRAQIAEEVAVFAGPNPRWYGYVDHYDWVLLSQLYGTLTDRPAGWPWGSINLAVLADRVGIDPENALWMGSEVDTAADHGLVLGEGAHHALAGALWARRLWEVIQTRAGDHPEYEALVDA